MKRNKLVLFTVFFAASLLIGSCRKMDKTGTMNEPGIALTFDDRNIDNWYKFLPVLDSLHVPVTFYISSYHLLSHEQKNKLKIMAAHGHEIGYHTTNHVDVAKYTAKHGGTQLLADEITPDLEKMKQDGFNPVVFAYPYGAHTQISDACLRHRFKSLRALNGTANLAKSLTASNDETMLYGLGIDNDGAKKDEEYDRLLESAAANANCVVFVAHLIEEENTKLKVPLSRLLHIIHKAQALHMRFYTVHEISAK